MLSGQIEDQTALYGLLRSISDLNLTLIVVNRVISNQTQFTNGENHEENYLVYR